MDYKTQTRVALMKGSALRSKGQGISYVGRGSFMDLMHDTGVLPRGSGTISHRAAVDRVLDSMNDLNITGGRVRKKDYCISGQGKPKAKKSKGSENFKSLKFNF